MNFDIDVIRKALDAAPPCAGLVWGDVTAPSKSLSLARNFDADLKVTFKGKTIPFHVEVKRQLHRAAIERIIALKNDLQSTRALMLVSDHVTTAQAEILHQNGVAFLDTVGNACLILSGLHLFVTGKAKKINEISNTAPLFHRAGLQVIFAFLTDPALDKNPESALLNKTFRNIKGQTGVALGSIGTTIGSLLESGYIVEENNLRFLTNRKQLFEKWVAAYVDRLRSKLVIKRYRSKGNSWCNATQSPGEGNYWGGEVAAAKLTGYLKPELAAIYSRGQIQQLILNADLRLDPQGDVEILKVFWGDWPHGTLNDCVHPLLVYADLMASEIDRNMDTAKRIYDRYLRDIIEPRG
ncbi:MAG: hypothetical protein E4H16_05425 [Candidatus Atribacteria bacterium]|nr:MAG: hypothetical protein E4H16_05425 [Candidatus Atribacteria bacterium]